MIVLQESASSQTVKFIPRSWVSGTNYKVRIVNETTNTEVYNQNTTGITENLYYNEYSAVFPVKEDIFYTFEVSKVSDSSIVYKDKIFCTNQTAYSVNDSAYTTHSEDNEFITL
jgi:hypothetical protein